MKTLDRKVLRDLRHMRGQVITIALVIASGIAIFVAALSNYYSLLFSQQSYYGESHFADIFAGLKRAPQSVAAQLAEIPGVATLETRIVFDATLDAPGISVPLSGRMISLPIQGEPKLNRLHLRRGRMVDPARSDEAVVSEAFADASGLKPGSAVTAVINGKQHPLRIVGVVLSPEYVFATPPGSPLPDDEHFGVFWLNHEPLAGATDMEGAFNDVVATLAPGAREEAVLAGLDRILAPYGGLIAYGRYDQLSNRFLSDEITQQGIMATTVPVIFLAVAAFLVNVVVGRMIAAQREQIAALKAIGYGNGAVAAHYLKFVSILVLGGTAAGIGLGAWLGRLTTATYTLYFRFPSLSYRLDPWVAILACAISLAAAFAGTLAAIRSVVALAPAEALRPPAPVVYRGTVFDRIPWVRRMPARSLIAVRGIVGHPLRAGLTILGIALAVPVVVLSLFWQDALDYMIDVQFAAADRGDAGVTFSEPVRFRAQREIQHMPGVIYAESLRSVPARLRAGPYSYRTAISGLPPDARLRRLLDENLQTVPLPPDGLLLSRRLAERLKVVPGSLVSVEALEGTRPQRDVRVAGVVNDMIGLSAYMDINALNRLMGEGDTISSVQLTYDKSRADELYRALKAAPKIETVAFKDLLVRSFRATTATFVLFLAGLLSLFAAIIASGVVYNNARVALQERAWDLASLRVLGFTRAEVSRLLLGELAIELLIAIPVGLVLGYWMVRGLIVLHETEMFQIPAVIEPRTYIVAVGVVLVAGAASAFIVRRRIDRLDLVAVLKARE